MNWIIAVQGLSQPRRQWSDAWTVGSSWRSRSLLEARDPRSLGLCRVDGWISCVPRVFQVIQVQKRTQGSVLLLYLFSDHGKSIVDSGLVLWFQTKSDPSESDFGIVRVRDSFVNIGHLLNLISREGTFQNELVEEFLKLTRVKCGNIFGGWRWGSGSPLCCKLEKIDYC